MCCRRQHLDGSFAESKICNYQNYMDVILIVLPFDKALLPAQHSLSHFEQRSNNHRTENRNHNQAGVNSCVHHHCFLIADVPADSVFCTEHFGGHKGYKGCTDSVENALENIWKCCRNCYFENLEEGSGTECFSDLKIYLACILNS